LGKIEKWLFTISENLDDISEIAENTDSVSESCSYVVDNPNRTIIKSISFEKRTMIVVATLNTLIRVYAIGKYNIIMLEKYLQSVIDAFTDELLDICDEILRHDKTNTTDISDLLSTESSNGVRYSQCAANIFDSVLTNFAKDNLLQKCLDSLFPSKLS
jgi:hypothetical protein